MGALSVTLRDHATIINITIFDETGADGGETPISSVEAPDVTVGNSRKGVVRCMLACPKQYEMLFNGDSDVFRVGVTRLRRTLDGELNYPSDEGGKSCKPSMDLWVRCVKCFGFQDSHYPNCPYYVQSIDDEEPEENVFVSPCRTQ